MASVNNVTLIGNVTRTPEKRQAGETSLTELGVAINRKYKVGDDVREDVTFIDVTFWGRQADTIAQYVTKGSPIYIEGRLQMDSWNDKDSGEKRSKLKVIGQNFQFLSGKASGSPVSSTNVINGSSPVSRPASSPDQIPF